MGPGSGGASVLALSGVVVDIGDPLGEDALADACDEHRLRVTALRSLDFRRSEAGHPTAILQVLPMAVPLLVG